jgi:hypothetical protein
MKNLKKNPVRSIFDWHRHILLGGLFAGLLTLTKHKWTFHCARSIRAVHHAE